MYGSFGIWIGRYQRWNSWDIVTRPDMVLMDVYLQIKDPITNMDTLGLSLVITIMILFSYLLLQSFITTENIKPIYISTIRSKLLGSIPRSAALLLPPVLLTIVN